MDVFFWKRYINGQKIHERVFNIINRHGNENQNCLPLRMSIIKKARDKCWWGCWEKGTLLHCRWECKLVQSVWKTVLRFLKKLNIELSYNPAISLLGTYPKEMTPLICIPTFTVVLFTTAKVWKQTKCPFMSNE